MPLRISIDAMLNHLEHSKQEDFTRLAARIPNTGNWAESFDLAKYIERLRTLRDAMTPGERLEPTTIDSRRRAQIAVESGWDVEALESLIYSLQRLSRLSDSYSSLTTWRVLGFSRFRPPDRA